MKKQLLLFLATLLPMMASADASGTRGGNLTWTYVETTHTLTISGEGSMANCDNYGSYGYSRSPWYSYGEEMTKAIIEDGVTSIGSRAFFGCSGLTSGDDPKPEPEPEPKPDEGDDDDGGGEVTPVTPE